MPRVMIRGAMRPVGVERRAPPRKMSVRSEKPEYEKFMDSPIGQFIQGISKSVSSGFLGQGKVAMIKAMAGEYDEAKAQETIDKYIAENKVMMFSFSK
ncbi:hypothetical protein AAMO2058_000392200 [Amorphochlora amoebiformis]